MPKEQDLANIIKDQVIEYLTEGGNPIYKIEWRELVSPASSASVSTGELNVVIVELTDRKAVKQGKKIAQIEWEHFILKRKVICRETLDAIIAKPLLEMTETLLFRSRCVYVERIVHMA
jgi:hypothetical protein